MEILVAVVIMGILSAAALPVYFHAVESARVAEAEMWLGSVVRAQQRYLVRFGKGYSKYWYSLDITPKQMKEEKYRLVSFYCMRDEAAPVQGDCKREGFRIDLYGTDSPFSGAVAQRVGSGKYGYKLARLYGEDQTLYCAAGAENTANDRDFCARFLGDDVYNAEAERILLKIENADVSKE